MMLLNAEEMAVALKQAYDFYVSVDNRPIKVLMLCENEFIAKAQLKKVVEELKDRQGLQRNDFDNRVYLWFTMAEEDWQSLLEEVT